LFVLLSFFGAKRREGRGAGLRSIALTYGFRPKSPVAFLWVQRTKNAAVGTLHSTVMPTF
jgi:hypothetical protein